MDSKKSLFIRVNGHTLKAETTEEEEEFRQTQFPNENSVLKKNINCTSCGKNIKEKIISKDIHIHPVLEVLWCKKCEEFYSDGDFSADEDGSDKYCRWCAQGGDLYCCSHCSVAFCVSCVKRNLPRKTLKDIEDDDWKCFVCVTNPLWPLRAICDAAKRYVDANTKSRKSSRLTKNQSEGDTTESEVSSRSRRRTKADSTEDEKYNADSEDTASTEANKNKRKYTTSSEDDTRKRSRRLKTSDEKTEPPPHPDEKKKDKFESIITDLINESAILRKLHTKTETSWKKNFLNIDVNNLNEYANKAEEDIVKFFKDFHTSIALIEKSFTDKFTILKKELSEKPQSPAPSDMEITVCDEPPASVDDPVGANDTANISDQNAKTPEKPETKIVEKSTSSPEKSSAEKSPANETPKAVEKSPLKSSDESNENADITVNGTDADVTIDEDVDKATPNDVSKKSAGDSLTVNFSSVIETLDSEEESILRKNDISDQPEPTEQPSNTDLQNDTVIFNENQNSKDESLNEVALKENEAKKLLLLSSSDSATECETKKLSSDSELSGVSVLHSDQDDANKTKQKRKKTRKELNNLAASRSDSDNDVTDEEKEIEKLSNLTNLKKRKSRLSSNSENSEKENKNSEKESSKKAKKAKKSKTSIVQYFGQESGNDTDTSNISISKFNSMLENKNKAFLNGEEELSKKVLLEFSSHDEKSDEEIPEEKLVEENAKQSTKQRKSSKKESLNESERKESDDEKLPEKTPENSLNDECEKEDVVDEKPEKSKWRSNRLLRGKLSETDTSDEERMREREKARKLQEEEKTIELSDHSSDSEDIFRSSKPCTTKKRRKKIAASSGSEFEVEKEKQSSDDSVQIISEEEKDTKKKKRRRIKKFDVSGSSDDDSDGKKKTPGSASKGRKNIRKMLKEEDLDEVTRKTAKEEEERKKRIAERQNLFNESFKIDESLDKAPSKLVLDFDPETKEEIIVVHPSLIKKLKPHQVKGVKFMWDSCYESVKMATTTPGGGCILAHCMGLGKTLQVIALVHTVMRYPVLNVNRVLILCPLSTVLNWVAEFEIWLQDVDYGDDIDVFNLNKTNQAVVRADLLNNWYKNGGVMILGYEMFRNLVNTNKVRKKIKQYYLDSLLDPGPDLVVCDEGHMLKNEQSALSQATMKIKCRRRIVLTGTPLQNNLVEYHCMVQFVKPNLLGEKKEFLNRFANPITNGQYSDSTSHDVRVMKRRAHVLHKMLDGVVQRFDYNVLTPFLPNKHEFVILVALSDVQAKLYEHYINTYSKKVFPMSTLFKDYQIMRLIWTHPYAMKLHQEKKRRIMEKRINSNDEDSEGSLRDFVVNSSESEDSSSNSGDSVVSIRSDDSNRNKKGRLTRAKKKELGINDDELQAIENDAPKSFDDEDVWWKSMVTDDEMNDYKMGPKLILLFAILKQCELIGDKLLVFSQSIPSLDMIEYFLEKLEDEESKTEKSESYYGTWQKGLDYFRLDGQTTPDLRKTYCNSFNKTSNTRSRLFLISTKAGGLGINLTAANRVIIFDASWNPSYDVQSIFRIYRFGQSKPCYVYRFLAQGTMEEKIYERQVTKLSISCRVVDEQQIDRHFNNADVVALYDFNRKKPCEDETPKLPKDRLMAELLKEYKNEIIGYHEHDSLLENIVEEELNEEERKQAWEDYENEKKGVHLQQNVPVFGGGLNFDRATIMEALKKEHPNVSESQLNVMHSMVVEKLKRHYIERLKLQQIQQMQDALNIRPNFNTQNIQRPPAPMMQYPQGQSTLSHFMANPAQQAKLKLDFAKKNTINNFLGGSSSQK